MNSKRNLRIMNISASENDYIGFISDGRREYTIRITLPEKDDLKNAVVKCSWKLKHILGDNIRIIAQRLKVSSSVPSFFMELQDLLNRQATQDSSLEKYLSNSNYYGTLIEHLNSLGWNRIVYMDADMKSIKIQASDKHNRIHFITMNLTSDFPHAAPRFKHDLPSPFEFLWNEGNKLEDVYFEFTHNLDRHQELWNYLDEIDAETWILEPENPKRSDCMRRIFLGNNSSLLVTLNPKYPSSFPEFRFLGSEKVIGKVQNVLNENIDSWNQNVSVLQNLRSILEIQFPSPNDQNAEDFTVECGICYSYRRDVMVPDKTCDGPCGKPFHSACLYEWLKSIPNIRQSFNTVFGECLYCGTSITCKMPTSLV